MRFILIIYFYQRRKTNYISHGKTAYLLDFMNRYDVIDYTKMIEFICRKRTSKYIIYVWHNEGTFSSVKSILSRDYVYHVDLDEL